MLGRGMDETHAKTLRTAGELQGGGGVRAWARARVCVCVCVCGVFVCGNQPRLLIHIPSFFLSVFLSVFLCLPLSLSSSPPSSSFPSGVIDKIDEFTDTTLHWLDEWLPLVKSLRILLVEARFGA